jgi:hypothetical protein
MNIVWLLQAAAAAIQALQAAVEGTGRTAEVTASVRICPSPLHMLLFGVPMFAVVHPSGQLRQEMESLLSVRTNSSRYRPLGQSRTTLSSQNLPGGTWHTSSLLSRVPL